jgi:hypothetical protein
MSTLTKSVSDVLGPKQQEAVDGPDGPPMYTFVCATCEKQYPDTNRYFYGIESTRCMWCTKFPKKQKARSDIKTV